jgi:hypothetical protein
MFLPRNFRRIVEKRMIESIEILPIKKCGRPKLPFDDRMEIFSVQIPHKIRQHLDLISIRCDKSVSELAREALSLLVFVYAKETRNE